MKIVETVLFLFDRATMRIDECLVAKATHAKTGANAHCVNSLICAYQLAVAGLSKISSPNERAIIKERINSLEKELRIFTKTGSLPKSRAVLSYKK